MPEPQEKPGVNKGAVAACIAAACAVATPLIMASEGLRTKPYLDPVKIPTVCYGETQVEMRAYSKDECGAMLRKRLAAIYAPKVLACLPQLAAPNRQQLQRRAGGRVQQPHGSAYPCRPLDGRMQQSRRLVHHGARPAHRRAQVVSRSRSAPR
jgi:hypothetical protein